MVKLEKIIKVTYSGIDKSESNFGQLFELTGEFQDFGEIIYYKIQTEMAKTLWSSIATTIAKSEEDSFFYEAYQIDLMKNGSIIAANELDTKNKKRNVILQYVSSGDITKEVYDNVCAKIEEYLNAEKLAQYKKDKINPYK